MLTVTLTENFIPRIFSLRGIQQNYLLGLDMPYTLGDLSLCLLSFLH